TPRRSEPSRRRPAGRFCRPSLSGRNYAGCSTPCTAGWRRPRPTATVRAPAKATRSRSPSPRNRRLPPAPRWSGASATSRRPATVAGLAEVPRGLVLVTGPTGSGKSTTLASLVDIINCEKPVHIMTVEDPIEFLHNHKQAVVNQREVGEDTNSFANDLKHVLRQDPDVILVGEMRDLETISTALTAAETGH